MIIECDVTRRARIARVGLRTRLLKAMFTPDQRDRFQTLPRPQAPLQERKKKQLGLNGKGRNRVVSLFLFNNPATKRAPRSTIPQLNGHRAQRSHNSMGTAREKGATPGDETVPNGSGPKIEPDRPSVYTGPIWNRPGTDPKLDLLFCRSIFGSLSGPDRVQNDPV